ncbi:lactonase family protein [Cellulophaga tyrosinoxydans]|uniref:6-phosphogluconolactonase, cycloisomerase 2 family n=1 Tax=Cellulophaga tyrosinoxydans TaxID=504486 RepID=A0A1W2C5B5_9FLAO|nr:lactonase family protein [Cellulophaga tyrosinoxydans]SMC80447.1 6-phosphogluconolactonase, cycloisomerase 2 family [Cellulophaga tyrosinoxydans]
MRLKKLLNLLSLLLIALMHFACVSKKQTTLLFVGSFTDKKPGKGIHIYKFNNDTGESILKFTLDSLTNTSFLRLSSNGKYLYSVVDSQMDYRGKVAAFRVDAINTKIHLLNMEDCGGINPAHIEISNVENLLTNSNYSDGSLSVFKINSDGSINPYSQVLKFKDSSIIKNRQSASHIHSSNFSPDGSYLFAQDLGADKIRRFKVVKNTDSILANENQLLVKPGSGPRHFAFHPNGKYGYMIAELSGKITAFQYNSGDLECLEDYPSYRHKQEIYRAADIHISPDGKFLYATNRGPAEDSISLFSINQQNGTLILIGHELTYGEHPRNFSISPDGKFLLVANQFSDNITVFKRNVHNGKLTKLSSDINVKNPSSIQMYTYTIFE